MSSVSSFRDPGGFCVTWDGRVLRALTATGLPDFEEFLASGTAQTLAAKGQVVPTHKLSEPERADLFNKEGFRALAGGREVAAVFEHERVAFPSYPYEWPPEMLHSAARLTLEVAQTCLEAGYGLKDATPYNVLFRGSSPIFIDMLSFERRHEADPVWRPHAQFCRTFLLPLLAHRQWGIRPADVFSQRRDGYDPSEVYRFCGPLRRFLPPFLTHVSLPTWLSRKPTDKAVYQEHRSSSPEKAQFILATLLKGLRRTVDSLAPSLGKQTTWSDYMQSHSYSEASFQAKEVFVQTALAEFKPQSVLDVGANTGHFSALAARAGARVVAIDYDVGCMGLLWRRAVDQQLNILPLVVDLARPSPAQGWRNRELPSFLERAQGGFDLVLMLAVLHHLLVTERVPLEEVLDLAASLTTRSLVIEFVSPEDDMFQALTRGRESLHADLTVEVFEAACAKRFRILNSVVLPGTKRRIYHLLVRDAS
jgi:SAM-dependent methyltransferase